MKAYVFKDGKPVTIDADVTIVSTETFEKVTLSCKPHSGLSDAEARALIESEYGPGPCDTTKG